MLQASPRGPLKSSTQQKQNESIDDKLEGETCLLLFPSNRVENRAGVYDSGEIHRC